MGKYRIQNKAKRTDVFLNEKKRKEHEKRDARFKRKREEAKNPALKEERLKKNIPASIDNKRVWDTFAGDEEDVLGLAMDVTQLPKKQKTEEAEDEDRDDEGTDNDEGTKDASENDGDIDSMLDEDSQDEDSDAEEDSKNKKKKRPESPSAARSASPGATSTGTDFELTPNFIMSKFPSLLEPPSEPKILITTSFFSSLHDQANMLTHFFPNSEYVPRSAHQHKYTHKYSVREIAKFASNRGYTTLVILNEDLKRPAGLDIVHLPHGPMFHFKLSNWVDRKKIPGHGNPTNHYPEMIMNNFRTPLGLLTAHLFRTMFPPQPEFQGRQVITLHNQRDYIFVRQHRYIFRDKRPSEKSITDNTGKPVKGVEDIKTGLQELGPRFTLKLRRVDRGIQRASGQEWQWKAGSEKQRTRFQL